MTDPRTGILSQMDDIINAVDGSENSDIVKAGGEALEEIVQSLENPLEFFSEGVSAIVDDVDVVAEEAAKELAGSDIVDSIINALGL